MATLRRRVEVLGLPVIALGAWSCAQVLDIDKSYHLEGTGGASSATSSGKSSSSSGTAAGGAGGGTTTSTTTTTTTTGTGGGSCGAGAMACAQPSDCGATGSPCVTAVCTGGCCGTQQVADGTPVGTQTAGDCQQTVCEGGLTKSKADDTDLPPGQDACHAGTCSGGVPGQGPKPPGAACASGGGHVCNGAGACVACNVSADCGGASICCNAACKPTVAAVSAGSAHTCARLTDGTLWCWGSNTGGQLGNGTTVGSAVPVQVAALGAAVAEVSAGGSNTCARKTDGTLWCWGNTFVGQVGDGLSTGPGCGGQCQPSPVQVAALGASAVHVAVGDETTCATDVNGALYCWGGSASGNLGDGSTASALSPVQVASLGNTVTDFAVSIATTCAREAAGTLWCWGNTTFGEIGNGLTTGPGCSNNCFTTPVQVAALGSAVTQVTTGNSFVCAVANAELYCWANNGNGQVGDGTSNDQRNAPVLIAANIAQVSAGEFHTCAQRGDGTLWCWGLNNDGQVGDGTTANAVTSPVQVAALGANVVGVSAGGLHTCAQKGDGSLWCWGLDSSGQLGNGIASGTYLSPIQVPLGTCP